jgi:hypothetical protein
MTSQFTAPGAIACAALPSLCIDSMHLKNVLGQIDTDSRNIHSGRSHPRLSGCKHFHFGMLMPFEGGASIPLGC